jgi:hypothetical protein
MAHGHSHRKGNSVNLHDIVKWEGRRYYLRGYARMSSVDAQFVHLQDVETGEWRTAPLDDVKPEPGGRSARGY